MLSLILKGQLGLQRYLDRTDVCGGEHAHHRGNPSPELECTAKAVLDFALLGFRQMGISHWR